MKIAYIALKGIPHCGGVEKYTEEIGARLAEKGHEVIVYTMRHYGTKDRMYKGMRIKTVPALKTRSLEKLSATFIATLFQFLEKDLDIVHFHAFGPSMFSFLPRLFGKTVLVQGHGLEWKRAKWGFFGKAFLKLSEIPSVRCPDIVSPVSKIQQTYLQKKYGIESIYIPPGVTTRRRKAPDLIKQYGLKGNDYIFFASRFVREKGIHYLIQSYKDIKTDLKLVIAGNTDNEEKYKSEILKMSNRNKNIIFTGFVTGKLLSELFSNAYMFVIPSETEGLSITLLEAMSYGNCCLASDIPENHEAMGNNGYYFRNKNIKSLSRQMEYLINNEDAVTSLKEKARSYITKKYSWDTITSDFERLYMNMLASPELKNATIK